jgi:hypothetical protein
MSANARLTPMLAGSHDLPGRQNREGGRRDQVLTEDVV